MTTIVSWFKLRGVQRSGLKLHLGSGTVKLDGWLNIDLETPEADIHLDITKGLPFADGAAKLVYHEHVMEHITLDQGRFCLRDWYRVLEPGGVLRVATPDLEYVVEKYKSADWREQAWLKLPEYAFISSPAEMINISMRWWGHQFLYDGAELERRMREAGFTEITRCRYGESEHADLRGLDTRPDSMLILEAVKR